MPSPVPGQVGPKESEKCAIHAPPEGSARIHTGDPERDTSTRKLLKHDAQADSESYPASGPAYSQPSALQSRGGGWIFIMCSL